MDFQNTSNSLLCRARAIPSLFLPSDIFLEVIELKTDVKKIIEEQ
jgi:hypothetical protein